MTASEANTDFSVSALLRAVWPSSTAKLAARVAGVSHRTVEDWLADRCCPSAKTLMRMAAADDRLCAELVTALSKGLSPHAPSLDQGPLSGNRHHLPSERGTARSAVHLGAGQR